MAHAGLSAGPRTTAPPVTVVGGTRDGLVETDAILVRHHNIVTLGTVKLVQVASDDGFVRPTRASAKWGVHIYAKYALKYIDLCIFCILIAYLLHIFVAY